MRVVLPERNHEPRTPDGTERADDMRVSAPVGGGGRLGVEPEHFGSFRIFHPDEDHGLSLLPLDMPRDRVSEGIYCISGRMGLLSSIPSISSTPGQ